ncbi:MAG: hypothetical protein A3I29_03900 [Candidatus Magasanikbacteria bacterium RIFCSPLOWO2_02_FULL_44_11]|uniref:bAvd-like domain-containing protein n=1 Tax=Candidatus Magasanikbacteria bacterium RIFCSPLOWO2_02_FULL_44_11 TaxID=1798689 RepID=A0A1F6N9F6_9BACT|nr:MAG: hypothetical protein A3I29_03900 [Candidatus Magasanikbacteria bacterium RIFCSPLOWO2_02_FULL_44_11]
MNTILLQKTYEVYRQVSVEIASFPKFDRYSVGMKIDSASLGLIEAIITAEQAEPILKDRALIEASVKNEVTKIFLRLALERKLIKETNYFVWSGMLVEVGKMIGGWRKSLRAS